MWDLLFCELRAFQTKFNLACYQLWIGRGCPLVSDFFSPLFWMLSSTQPANSYFFCRYMHIRTRYWTYPNDKNEWPACGNWTSSLNLILDHLAYWCFFPQWAISKYHIILSACVWGGCSGWIKWKMKWERSTRKGTTVHESYFSKFPSSKPALLANTISHQLSNRWVHTLETQTHSGYGNKGRGLWEPEQRHGGCQPNLKKSDLTNAKRWCGGEDPSLWSHANPAGLESECVKSLINFSQIFVLFSHRLWFLPFLPIKGHILVKVLLKTSQMFWQNKFSLVLFVLRLH